jgi:hypothetical protein
MFVEYFFRKSYFSETLVKEIAKQLTIKSWNGTDRDKLWLKSSSQEFSIGRTKRTGKC